MFRRMRLKMNKSKLHLLDAGIIVELFRLGIWENVVSHFDISVSEIVAGEAHFFRDQKGNRQTIDLAEFVDNNRIQSVFATPSQAQEFLSHFGPDHAERLDPGELESLACLFSSSEDTLICSADSIVFIVLGATDNRDWGVSLEEMLKQCGLARVLDWRFTRKFREQYSDQGFQDRMTGMGPSGL